MNRKDGQSGRWTVRPIHFGAFLLCLGWTIALQWMNNAFVAEFSASDEPSHFVTGLMVRDYLAAFLPSSPVSFAENYYLHYPLVALGHWPPVFYLAQAGWELVVPVSRITILLFIALLGALWGATIASLVSAEFGWPAGIAAAVLVPALPLVQEFSSGVFPEILVALLSLWATISMGRYVDTERAGEAIKFGVLAALAIMTKPNGWALALVPPFTVFFSRRFSLLRRWSFWRPAVLVPLLCVPWYLWTLSMARAGWAGGTSVWFLRRVLIFNSREMVALVGIGLFLFIVLGIAFRLVLPWRNGSATGIWAAMGALLLAVWGFHTFLVPAREERHLLTAVPALVMFLAAGIEEAAARLPLWVGRYRTLLVALLAVIVFLAGTFSLSKRTTYGFSEAASVILGQPQFQNSVFLVSSQGNGEGMFVAEVALGERRPGHIVLRASKVLPQPGMPPSRNRSRFRNAGELMNFLESIPAGILVIDGAPGRGPLDYHRQLMEMVEAYPERWKKLGTFPQQGPGATQAHIRVYRLAGHEGRPVGKIRVDLTRMLGRFVEN